MTLTEASEWAGIIAAIAAVIALVGIPVVKRIRSSSQNQTVGNNSTAVQSGRDSNVEINNDKAKSGSWKR
ncbi:hypothetical protein [Hyphomicrobium sp. MC1]|uniref:hypothetical protein n=1 Tax=Hyphomicrobium sp. (strain MC1) TaxID=717785 RepID=UPI000213F040|nr:hypothetical protein [Hyphomicrobium sp. MC1]CCB67947.1 protein of unknown function [Hyphomicrobium sp. MC1]